MLRIYRIWGAWLLLFFIAYGCLLAGNSVTASASTRQNAGFFGSNFASTLTPTLSYSKETVGFSLAVATASGNDFEYYLEPSGYVGATTTGELVITPFAVPSAVTVSDSASDSYASATTCTATTIFGIEYAQNATAGMSSVKFHFAANVNSEWGDVYKFYNVATSSALDNGSCKNSVTPANNTAPNISGTAYTVAAAGELTIICVADQNYPSNAPNAISSYSWPSGFSGLSQEPEAVGHACAYSTSVAAGSFTPTFTAAQATHDAWTIMAASFKAGSGGSAPSTGNGYVMHELEYHGSSAATVHYILPCPSGTTAVTFTLDTGVATGVTDSNSNTFTRATHQATWGDVWKELTPGTMGNTYQVNVVYAAGGNNIGDLACLVGVNAVDTGVTAANSSTLDGASSGTTYNFGSESSTTVSDAPSMVTSVAGDLVLQALNVGTGPFTNCASSSCVFDTVGATWASGGDIQADSNGDALAHVLVTTATTQQFQFTVVNNTSAWQAIATAFK